MNMMEFLQIARRSASRMGTAVDRCDISYIKRHNYTSARVWLSNVWIFDIVDDLNDIRKYNGGEGNYLVKFRNEFYKLEDEMDEVEFNRLIYQMYMNHLEAEEDMRDDN